MKILATDGFSELGIRKLSEAGHEVQVKNIAPNQLVNYINSNAIDGILVKSSTPISKSVLSELTNLKFIGNCDSQSSHIDLDFAKQKGINLFQAENAWTNSTAELTIAHLLSCLRHLKDSNREMPLEGDQNFNALKKSLSRGVELKGKTLGIIGFGKIGQEVAKKAIALGMEVKFYDTEIDAAKLSLSFVQDQVLEVKLTGSSFEDVLSTSDAISLHISEPSTYVITAKELKLMKPSAGIINTSNGKCIDEVALVNSLNNNELGFGALDVFEDQPQPPIQLLMNPKLSLSPNLSGATQETQDRISEEISDQILSFSN